MPVLHAAKVDMIDELMFRCWARRNYLPPELRDADWHPIILEEMAQRDRELAEEIREDHLLMAEPSRYVPLVPVVTHYVHPAQSEIREPHYLTVAQSFRGLYADASYGGGIYDFGF